MDNRLETKMMKISKAKLRKIIMEEIQTEVEALGADRRAIERRPLRNAIASLISALSDRVGALERKMEDMGMGEPGTPFQENKK